VGYKKGETYHKWKPLASRPTGRPKNGWKDNVRNDLQTVETKNWKNILNRDLWKTIVERTKTHTAVASIKKNKHILILIWGHAVV
jgi:hypothetical protein